MSHDLQSINNNLRAESSRLEAELTKERKKSKALQKAHDKTRDEIMDSLREIDVPFQICKYSPVGIRLLKRFPINGNKLFKSGNIEIQGEASQLSALLLGVKPGMQVADICAGAGGNSRTP